MNQNDFHILEAIHDIFNEVYLKIDTFPRIAKVWLSEQTNILQSFLNMFNGMNF